MHFILHQTISKGVSAQTRIPNSILEALEAEPRDCGVSLHSMHAQQCLGMDSFGPQAEVVPGPGHWPMTLRNWGSTQAPSDLEFATGYTE